MSSRRGEVITFADEGGSCMTRDGPHFYVRGHVPYEEAYESIEQWIAEEECLNDDEDVAPFMPVFGRVRHTWARWVFMGYSSAQERFRYFNTYRNKSRGTFPVTELTDVTWFQQRYDTAIKSARAETQALERWPGIEILSSWGYQDPGVRFKFPGGKYTATWSMKDRNQVWVPLIDEEAWTKFVAECRAAKG
jgi:hypothetical protein